MKDLRPGLEALKAEHQYRRRRSAAGPQQPQRVIDGEHMLGFCSNDYLGLANHPRLVNAFKKAADEYGVGSGSAHLINGHTTVHHQLEDRLAEFTGRDRALLFSTGYMANIGVACALAARGDSIFSDRLNHASLIDGARLSGAKLKRYLHKDMDSLGSQLDLSPRGEKLIMSDGVFSMDGDLADVAGLMAQAKRTDSWLMIDDAHGIGVLGEQGGGTLKQFNASQDDVPILMGTLGKGLGTAGAFVSGSEALIEHLIQSARSYIFTTALPAAVAAATLESLKLVKEEPQRRGHLIEIVEYFRSSARQLNIPILDSPTPIQAVVVGENATAIKLSECLWEKGIQVTAIRPPTVPKGTARLRITFSAAHSKSDVDQLLEALAAAMPA